MNAWCRVALELAPVGDCSVAAGYALTPTATVFAAAGDRWMAMRSDRSGLTSIESLWQD